MDNSLVGPDASGVGVGVEEGSDLLLEKVSLHAGEVKDSMGSHLHICLPENHEIAPQTAVAASSALGELVVLTSPVSAPSQGNFKPQPKGFLPPNKQSVVFD